jgi:hypothetical protein
MEQFLLEPVELTDTEIDAVAGGIATAAAASAVGDNFAAAAGATGVTLTIGNVSVSVANLALAVGF